MSSIPNLVEKVDLPARANVWMGSILPALFAAAFGLMLIYGAGFAETAELHNAAHDGRHSAGFPCH
jgi:cobalt transporter subunit CbtB